MTQHTQDTSKGQSMAIDFEKDEQRRVEAQERRQMSAQTALRTASAVHHAVAVADMVGGARAGFSSGVGAASAIGAAIEVGESLESGLTEPNVDERMQRFPELKEVEVPTGAAARFPELAEQPQAAQIDDEELDR